MANRNLSPDELALANELLKEIRGRLATLSGDDPVLLFAYRRKIAKELSYDERGKPADRKKIKFLRWGLQNRLCAHCGKELPLEYSELDRKNAADGYTVDNTELVHGQCHIERQRSKNYT